MACTHQRLRAWWRLCSQSLELHWRKATSQSPATRRTARIAAWSRRRMGGRVAAGDAPAIPRIRSGFAASGKFATSVQRSKPAALPAKPSARQSFVSSGTRRHSHPAPQCTPALIRCWATLTLAVATPSVLAHALARAFATYLTSRRQQDRRLRRHVSLLAGDTSKSKSRFKETAELQAQRRGFRCHPDSLAAGRSSAELKAARHPTRPRPVGTVILSHGRTSDHASPFFRVFALSLNNGRTILPACTWARAEANRPCTCK